jgi:hypothetical protein
VAKHIEVYLEIASKKVFAGGLDWPGWCRSGPDEVAALQALVHYGPRYKKAMGSVTKDLSAPASPSDFEVVERLKGNATTDFGVPGKIPSLDDEDIDAAEAKRLASFMKAAWKKFDKTADQAAGVALRKGPRGGGRDLNKIVEHVLGGEISYLYGLGKKFKTSAKTLEQEIAEERKTFLETLAIRARGEEAEPMGRRTAKLWSARYAVRRAVWHILDHAWEIEDRRES